MLGAADGSAGGADRAAEPARLTSRLLEEGEQGFDRFAQGLAAAEVKRLLAAVAAKGEAGIGAELSGTVAAPTFDDGTGAGEEAAPGEEESGDAAEANLVAWAKGFGLGAEIGWKVHTRREM